MKKLHFLAALLMLISFAASAEVAPLGQVIGKGTVASVKADIGSRVSLQIGKPDIVSGRPMLVGDGPVWVFRVSERSASRSIRTRFSSRSC